jgi:formamidopyrimidine-DNA glycosylase
MAEVPEVEIIVRDLRQAVAGRAFTFAEVLAPECVRFPAPAELVAQLPGRRVAGAERRAKHILVRLEEDWTLAIHFMLWGELQLRPEGAPSLPALLARFGLEGGEELQLTDTLGYARVALGPTPALEAGLKLAELGPEALEEGFGPGVLAARLRKRRSPLKTLLLDQKVLAGLGNRDADEALWRAGIDPRRTAASLSPAEVVALAAAIRVVLDEGIALRGTQRDLFGVKGQARHRRNVFECTGKPCPRCATPVEHVRINGRNTHYCPHCQPEQGQPAQGQPAQGQPAQGHPARGAGAAGGRGAGSGAPGASRGGTGLLPFDLPGGERGG